MNSPYKQAVDYIDSHLKKNVPVQDLRKHFLRHGWTDEHINKAFHEHAQTQKTEPKPPVRPPHTYSHPAKYNIFGVIEDVTKAIGRNPRAYLASTGLATLALLIVLFSGVSVPFASPTLAAFLVFIIGTALAINVFQAIMLGMMSVLLKALYEDRTIKALSPLKGTLKVWRRLVLTNLLWNTIMFAPLIIPFIPLMFVSEITQFVFILLLAFPLIIAWVLIIGLRFCISPVVAQNETRIPIRKCLTRSQKLLGTRGQVIAVLGFIFYAIVSSLLNSYSPNDFVSLIQAVASLVLITYVYGGLAAIYFNRAGQKSSKR